MILHQVLILLEMLVLLVPLVLTYAFLISMITFCHFALESRYRNILDNYYPDLVYSKYLR